MNKVTESSELRQRYDRRRGLVESAAASVPAILPDDSPLEHVSDSPPVLDLVQPESDDMCLYPSPSPHLEEQAICHFFYNFVAPACDGQYGYFDSLPALCQQYSDTPYLRDALSAVSIANFAKHGNMEQLSFIASMCYGKTLSSFIPVLSNEAEAKTDKVLATSVLIALYEVSK
jgi:hypothetical protein